MTPSKYQMAVFDHIAEVVKVIKSTGIYPNNRHTRVDALAGSGKSTTGKHLLKYLPQEDAPLFAAFNKLIAEALSKDIKSYHPKAEACTLHRFGYRVLRSAIKGCKVDCYKTDQILQVTRFDLNNRVEKNNYFKYRGCIGRLVSLLKAEGFYGEDDLTVDGVLEIADKYGVEIPGKPDWVAGVTIETFNHSRNSIAGMGVIDFDDMIYGPTYLNLSVPQYKWMIVDEFQDMNKSQLDLIYAAGKEGTIIVFGDRHQSIYGFRGALSGIMDLFKESLSATCLPLSICYRCPKSVIAEAQKIVPEIEAAPNAIEGVVCHIKEDEFTTLVKDGDFVLCRYTAPLVSKCLDMIQEGRKAYVKGRDIGKNFVFLIKKINDSMPGSDLLYKINSYAHQEESKLSAMGREDLVEQFNDKIDTIKALYSGCQLVCSKCGQPQQTGTHGFETKDLTITCGHQFEESNPTVDAIEKKIESIFSDDAKSGIMFSTVHRAKGLEAKVVFALKVPKKNGKGLNNWQQEQERNLEYVQVTRSLEQFYYVQGK